MTNTCVIDIADGLGNIIQSTPFINEMKKKYDRVIGHNRPDSTHSTALVEHLYDELIPRGSVPHDVKWYPIPNLGKMGSYPEYKSWFKFHREPMPDQFMFDVRCTVGFRKFDVCIWGGCKPAWEMKMWCHWDELVKELLDRHLSVAIVGLPGEGPSNLPHHDKLWDFRGEISLMETGGVMFNSNTFIGNEGGLMHYSAAVGTDTYVVMGGSDPIKNLPPGIGDCQKVIPISANMDCQPCQFNGCYTERGIRYGCHVRELVGGMYARCLHAITPEIVIERIGI